MLLKSLLNIVGNRQESENLWVYAEDGRVDVLVLDLDDDEDEPPLTRFQEAIVVAMSRDTTRLAGQEYSLLKPLRSKELVHLLTSLDDRIKSHLAESSATPHREKITTNPLDAIVFALKDQHAKLLRLEFDGVPIYLDIVHRRVYLGAGFSYENAAAATRFTCVEAHELAADGFACVSLADFFYEYTLGTRSATLLAGLSQDSRFYIRQWPQFMNTANTRSLVKLSAYFSRRRATLQAATNELLVGMNQLVAYVNAVYAQGLLMIEADMPTSVAAAIVPAQPVAGSMSRSGFGGLFGKIRQKLGL